MKNYEAAELVEMGQASTLILGAKPYFPLGMDSEGMVWFFEPMFDIDEVDEP